MVTGFTVTVDGDKRRLRGLSHVLPGDRVGLKVDPIPDGAVVIVSYTKLPNPIYHVKSHNTSLLVEDFRWNVSTNMQIPTVAEVYEALRSYFSGTVTLSEAEGVLGAAEGKTYHEKLSEEVAAGRLHERLPAGERTKLGTDESSGWHQVGTPSLPPGPSDTCGGKTVPGGVLTLTEGGFQGDDWAEFFWMCTQDGEWVPVRLPQPGVDYAYDHQLLRPGDPGYNEECRYVRRDEDGNLVLDENGDRIPAPVSRYDPKTDSFTWNDGNSWDPIAEKCTGRGNP